jgi:DNA-binding MarR family transcriptional regulator
MESVSDSGPAAAARRRQLNRGVREALRDMSVQLSLLNHQVGGHLALKGSDLECLDLIQRQGPLSPSEVARRAGLHPATMTGILDRLERGGWIERDRDRDSSDRRAVAVRAARGRVGEVLGLYSGMNTAMDQICAEYDDGDLELLAGFLRRTADAGRAAARDLTGKPGQ